MTAPQPQDAYRFSGKDPKTAVQPQGRLGGRSRRLWPWFWRCPGVRSAVGAAACADGSADPPWTPGLHETSCHPHAPKSAHWSADRA